MTLKIYVPSNNYFLFNHISYGANDHTPKKENKKTSQFVGGISKS